MYISPLSCRTMRLVASLLACATVGSVSAQTYTWTGAGGGDSMSSVVNWVGGDVPAFDGVANELWFGEPLDGYVEDGRYVVAQSISGSGLNFTSLVFSHDALAYKLYDAPLQVHSNGTWIRNQSAYRQWIENDIIVDAGGSGVWSGAGLILDTGEAGILWSGTSELGAGQRTIWKAGTGDLVIAGVHHVQGSGTGADWRVLAGTLVLDMDAGGDFIRDNPTQSTLIALGSNVGSTLGNNAHFRLVGYENGATTSSLIALGWEVGDGGGRRSITVDSNGGTAELRLAGFSDGRHTSLHLDISTPGSSITTTGGAPDFSGHGWDGPSGLYYSVTINDGTKVGFATYVDNSGTKSYSRYQGAFTELVGDVIGHDINYYLDEGQTSIHTTNKGSFLFGTTLTIRNVDGSGGSYVNNAGSGGLYFRGLLMEEGVGDYVFNPLYGNGITGNNYYGAVVHQYSTHGALIFANGVNLPGAFFKTGPGAVVLQGDSPHTGEIYVQQGLLRVEGTALGVSQWVVYDDASLGGPGAIGSGQNVIVMAGGSLVGTNHSEKGLTVATGVDLREGSNFYMEIGEVRQDPLAIAGNVLLAGNLELILDYAPAWNETITLLTYGGSLTGEFATINGGLFQGINGDEFSLTYGATSYDFQILYNVGSIDIMVTAIPEPEVITLLVGIGLFGLVRYRRRFL